MSFGLLNRELEKAFLDLDEEHHKNEKPKSGPRTHAVKKRQKFKPNKLPKVTSKLSWKFAELPKSGTTDLTEASLKFLNKLDKGAIVNSEEIVSHHRKEKRQSVVEKKEKLSKLEQEEIGTVFTDEDFDKFSKEYFLHSKTDPVKDD